LLRDDPGPAAAHRRPDQRRRQPPPARLGAALAQLAPAQRAPAPGHAGTHPATPADAPSRPGRQPDAPGSARPAGPPAVGDPERDPGWLWPTPGRVVRAVRVPSTQSKVHSTEYRGQHRDRTEYTVQSTEVSAGWGEASPV